MGSPSVCSELAGEPMPPAVIMQVLTITEEQLAHHGLPIYAQCGEFAYSLLPG